MDPTALDEEFEEQDFETAEARREAAAALHDASHLALLALSDGTSIPRTRAALLSVVAGDEPPGMDGGGADSAAGDATGTQAPPPALSGRKVLSLDNMLVVVLNGGWERRKERARRRAGRREGRAGEHDAGADGGEAGAGGGRGDGHAGAGAVDHDDAEAWAAALDPQG